MRGLQLYKSGKVFENSFSGTRFKGICITLMFLLVVSKCLSYVITRALPKYIIHTNKNPVIFLQSLVRFLNLARMLC